MRPVYLYLYIYIVYTLGIGLSLFTQNEGFFDIFLKITFAKGF